MMVVLVLQGDNILKVVIQDYIVVNPHVIRVNLYTYNPEEQTTEQGLRDYQIAVGSAEFTTQESDKSIGIDLARLQQILSEKIVQSQNVANLVAALQNADIQEWDLVIDQPVTREQASTDGMTLAFGEEKNNGTTTN